MKLFIEIDIGKSDKPNHWIQFASSLSDDLMGTGLQSNSEAAVAGMVNMLMSQAQKVGVLLVVHDELEEIGCPENLLEFMSAFARPLTVWLHGHHRSLECQLELKSIRFVRIKEIGQVREEIRKFAQ